MPWEMHTSIDASMRDMERWTKDLAALEAAGLAASCHADAVRGWIAMVKQIIADSWHYDNTTSSNGG